VRTGRRHEETVMHIRYGYAIDVVCDQPTPAVLMLDVHPDRRRDIVRPDDLSVTGLATGMRLPEPRTYLDAFGNICRRLHLPAGGARLAAEGIIHDAGFTDPIAPDALLAAPESLPSDSLAYLLGSRYCETDKLMAIAWDRFGTIDNGWRRVQAICDMVHGHITFDYAAARNTRTAAEVFEERVGVCRDFTHLAVAFCRCMNIPARYCTGYLGDIGVPINPDPMDFSAWFEAFLDGRWYAFDPRHNMPRIGRIVIARGRDATDVPFLNSFGAHGLATFEVITEEITDARFPITAAERRDHWSAMTSRRASAAGA
jgi:transglutaminase-like putative cysteine protease